MTRMNRKDFLKAAAVSAGAMGLAACGVPASGDSSLETQGKAMTHKKSKPCRDLNVKGSLDLSLIRGVAQIPGEFFPDLVCNITDKKARVSWDKAANKVRIQVSMKNVPRRPTVTRPPGTNALTPFTPVWPETVTDAAYQVWLITMTPFRQRRFYYDGTSFELLGSDATITQRPAGSLVLYYPVQALVCSPLIEPTRSGRLHLDWKFDYDKIIDSAGNAGQESTFGPLNLKTNAGQFRTLNSEIIPKENALSFDDFLRGDGFALDSTFEPNPKPPTLTSKFNNFILAGQVAYFPVPEGAYFDLHYGEVGFYPSPCGGFVGPLRDGKNTCS